MLPALARLDRAIGAALRPVVFAGMAALIAVITLQIVSRVFFTAVGWTEEVARFTLIWITFLGAALAFQQGRHIAVAIVVDLLPRRARRAVEASALVVTIGFLSVLAVVAYRYTQMQAFQRAPSLQVSMSYFYAVIPFSAALMALLCLVDLIRVSMGAAPRREGAVPEA